MYCDFIKTPATGEKCYSEAFWEVTIRSGSSRTESTVARCYSHLLPTVEFVVKWPSEAYPHYFLSDIKRVVVRAGG